MKLFFHALMVLHFGIAADATVLNCDSAKTYDFSISALQAGASAKVYKDKTLAEYGRLKCTKPSDPNDARLGAVLDCRSNVNDAGFTALVFKGKGKEYRVKLHSMAFDGVKALAELSCVLR